MNDPRVFRYNESAAITSMDPAAARSLEHMWVVDQLYDGLVELTPDLEVVPCLARSWTFNDSSLTYRFKLRDDVLFTTGRRLTAADVVASLERLRDPQVISSGGWILDAVVPGGIVAVNDSILDIQLNKPYPPFSWPFDHGLRQHRRQQGNRGRGCVVEKSTPGFGSVSIGVVAT